MPDFTNSVESNPPTQEIIDNASHKEEQFQLLSAKLAGADNVESQYVVYEDEGMIINLSDYNLSQDEVALLFQLIQYYQERANNGADPLPKIVAVKLNVSAESLSDEAFSILMENYMLFIASFGFEFLNASEVRSTTIQQAQQSDSVFQPPKAQISLQREEESQRDVLIEQIASTLSGPRETDIIRSIQSNAAFEVLGQEINHHLKAYLQSTYPQLKENNDEYFLTILLKEDLGNFVFYEASADLLQQFYASFLAREEMITGINDSGFSFLPEDDVPVVPEMFDNTKGQINSNMPTIKMTKPIQNVGEEFDPFKETMQLSEMGSPYDQNYRRLYELLQVRGFDVTAEIRRHPFVTYTPPQKIKPGVIYREGFVEGYQIAIKNVASPSVSIQNFLYAFSTFHQFCLYSFRIALLDINGKSLHSSQLTQSFYIYMQDILNLGIKVKIRHLTPSFVQEIRSYFSPPGAQNLSFPDVYTYEKAPVRKLAQPTTPDTKTSVYHDNKVALFKANGQQDLADIYEQVLLSLQTGNVQAIPPSFLKKKSSSSTEVGKKAASLGYSLSLRYVVASAMPKYFVSDVLRAIIDYNHFPINSDEKVSRLLMSDDILIENDEKHPEFLLHLNQLLQSDVTVVIHQLTQDREASLLANLDKNAVGNLKLRHTRTAAALESLPAMNSNSSS